MSKRELDLVSIILLDEDQNLPLDNAVICKFKDITIKKGEDPQMTLLNLAVNYDIKAILIKHNAIRKGIINKTTLERTGKSVPLSEITIEDVSVKIQ